MIIFMGVAGAGKSIQGKLLADRVGLPWLSTGEFFRMLVSGQKRKDMVAGKLLGDHDTISLVQKVFAIVGTDQEFVLDGFPRTLPQADWLLSQVKHGQLNITAVVQLNTPEEIVQQRLLNRGRQDDTAEAISRRFEEYRQLTVPIIEEFREAGVRVVDIEGNGDVETIHRKIVTALQIGK
jgi:adenylate kinase